jgi:hypothetical protein
VPTVHDEDAEDHDSYDIDPPELMVNLPTQSISPLFRTERRYETLSVKYTLLASFDDSEVTLATDCVLPLWNSSKSAIVNLTLMGLATLLLVSRMNESGFGAR